MTAISTMVASRGLAPYALYAVLLLGLALILGRFFCGLVCPLGALFDAADALVVRRLRVRLGGRVKSGSSPGATRRGTARDLSSLKYAVLAVVLVSAAFGSVALLALDPLSLLTRAGALVVWPLSARLLRAVLGGEGHSIALGVDVWSAGLLIVLIVLGAVQSRFWCRNLCPLGALFGVVGTFGFRRRVGKGCTRCGRCREICHTGAIEEDERLTRVRECTLCLECRDVCPVNVIGFTHRFSAPRRAASVKQPASNGPARARWAPPGADLSRRDFLGAGGALAAGVLTGLTLRPRGTRCGLLRPPGAMEEERFKALCVRCGLCVKACNFNALHPVVDSLEGFWTPHFRMRVSGCDPDCNACTQVCPTGAIEPLDLERKRRVRIGLAEIDRSSCFLWTEEKICQICADACRDAGYDAVVLRFETGFLRVHVDEARCTGCGWCEFRCPVNIGGHPGAKGGAAVRVTPRAQGSLRPAPPAPD